MRMIKQCVAFLMAALMFGVAANAFAQEAPDVMIMRVSKEVMDAAKSNSAIRAGNKRQIYQLVHNKIFPHVDFQRMTALAAGKYWKEATNSQKTRLSNEFRDLLVHTYANAISKISNQRLEFKPLNLSANATQAIVHSRIIQARGGSPIQLSYRVAKSGSSWKIYDVNVLGAWLVSTYKGSFANEISRNGIDGLISSLARKNKQLASR